MRLKALVVVGDGVEDYGDFLAVGRTEAKTIKEKIAKHYFAVGTSF